MTSGINPSSGFAYVLRLDRHRGSELGEKQNMYSVITKDVTIMLRDGENSFF